jgi:hypothetical protein
MRCFGYAGGITPPDWLEGPGTIVFTDMAELPALIASADQDESASADPRP